MTEHALARRWREASGLTREALASLSGYSPPSIYWFEEGKRPTGRPIARQVWLRYRNVCAGVAAQMRSNKTFNWGAEK